MLDKTCNQCGKEITKGKFCKECIKMQMKKRNPIIIIVSIITAIVVGTFTFISGINSGSIQDQNDNEITNNSDIQIFNVGDTIELNGYILKVNQVGYIEGNEFFQPKTGNVFFGIDCTLENRTDVVQHISSVMMFDVVDSNGRSYDQSIAAMTVLSNAGNLDGDLQPGRMMSGIYAIEIPIDTVGLELEFSDPFMNGIAVFKLN